MYDKAKRIERLARLLCSIVPGADPDDAARAGLLCKADLVTEMVGEFPICRVSWDATTHCMALRDLW